MRSILCVCEIQILIHEDHIQGPRNQLREEDLKHEIFCSPVVILNVCLNPYEMILLLVSFRNQRGARKPALYPIL